MISTFGVARNRKMSESSALVGAAIKRQDASTPAAARPSQPFPAGFHVLFISFSPLRKALITCARGDGTVVDQGVDPGPGGEPCRGSCDPRNHGEIGKSEVDAVAGLNGERPGDAGG